MPKVGEKGRIVGSHTGDALSYLRSMTCRALFVGVLVLALLVSLPVGAQEKEMSRAVGFADTVLFCADVPYTQYNYSGPAPLFVQAWFPLLEEPDSPRLTYGALRQARVPHALETVYAEIWKKSDPLFVDYNIAYSASEEKELRHVVSPDTILARIKGLPTWSYRAPWPAKQGLPVLVYHHGAGGVSDENLAMAEFFAAAGYLVISASFHLPYEGMPAGSSPWMEVSPFERDRFLTRTVLGFAREQAGSSPVVLVGHSWGAQAGWATLHERGWADVFISLETTLEFFDDEGVRTRWPELYELMTSEDVTYDLPILHVATLPCDQPFVFFDNVRAPQRQRWCPLRPLAHNAYTSVYTLRRSLHETIPQPDIEELDEQRLAYLELLQRIDEFLRQK